MALTPVDIYHRDFRRAPFGRRGYDEHDVDDFLDTVGREMRRLMQINDQLHQSAGLEKAELASQLAELRGQLAATGQAAAAGGADPAEVAGLRRELAAARRDLEHLAAESDKDQLGVSTRAVTLLAQAQASADQTIADAEAYARDLVLTAREQHRDLLARAHRGAAAQVDAGTPIAAALESLPQFDQLRTYTQIAQTQLRAVLASLSAEVDKLTGLPAPAPSTTTTAPADSTARHRSPDVHSAIAVGDNDVPVVVTFPTATINGHGFGDPRPGQR